MVIPADKNSAVPAFHLLPQKDCPKPQLQAVNGNTSSLQSMSDKPSTVWNIFSSIVSSIWNCLKNLFSCCSAASVENATHDLHADMSLKGKATIEEQLKQLPSPNHNASFKSALIIKLDDQIIGYHFGPIAKNDLSSVAIFQDQSIKKMEQGLVEKKISPKSALSIQTFFIEKLDPNNFELNSKFHRFNPSVKPSLNDISGKSIQINGFRNIAASRYLAISCSSKQKDPIFKDQQNNPIINYLLEEFRKK